MMLHVPDVLTPEEALYCRKQLEQANWADGKVTAGYQSAKAKHNLQLLETHPLAQELGEMIHKALWRNPLFIAGALPDKIYPPLFNKYEGGGHFANHIDNAIREIRGAGVRIRTDVSATLFLSDPDEYEGGELIIQDTYSSQSVKLPMGHMVVYPGTSLHRVAPVTKGARIASFFWIQSIVREDAQRALLFELDNAIQKVSMELPEHESVVALTGVYHNLIRRWSDV